MFRFFLAAVDVLPAAVVLAPVFALFYFTVYGRNFRRSVLCCLFCLYLAAVFSLVGIPNITYIRPEINLNLLPVLGMLADFKNSVLNVILFVPLGIFLPLLWQQFRKCGRTVLFGFGLSLTVELLQMLTFRATDVNDLITNTVGTVLGFFLVNSLGNKSCAAGNGKGEPFVLCILSFGVMFFLHPLLSPFIYDRLL